jgi:hypothetical protein
MGRIKYYHDYDGYADMFRALDEEGSVKAELTVNTNAKHESNTLYPAKDPGWRKTTAPGMATHEGYGEQWAKDTRTEVGQTIPLFEHSSRNEGGTVEYMRTAQDSRSLALPMLGIAARTVMNERRMEMRPSDDLSDNSGRLVRRLNHNLGTQFSPETSNDLDFDDADDLKYRPKGTYGSETQVPDEEVEAGRRLGRSIARRPPMPIAYQQLRLF